MNSLFYSIATLILGLSLNLSANETSDKEVFEVSGSLARTVYKTFAKYTDKQCDDKGCFVEVDQLSCEGFSGFYTCTLGHYEGNQYVLTMLMMGSAKSLYNSLQKINKAFCDNEYSQMCVNYFQGVSCHRSGNFLKRNYFCEVRI